MVHVQTQLILLLTYDKKIEKTGISDEVPVFFCLLFSDGNS